VSVGPFTVQAQPTAAALRPAAADFAEIQPELEDTFGVLNNLFNGLAYNPPGKQEGYLFWLAWANHMAASMLSSQDGMGPTRRGVVFGSCDSLRVYETIGRANAILGTLVKLLNAPDFQQTCGTGTRAAAAGKAASSAILRQGAAQGDPLHRAVLKALGEEPPPIIRRPASRAASAGASG
jgi:hypothetical protein